MTALVEWFDDLDAVAADAAGALDRTAQPCLFDRLDWFRLTRMHILPDAGIAVVRVASGDARAWLFLIDAGSRAAAPLSSWYSLRFGPILSEPRDEALIECLYRAVSRRFDRVALHPLRNAEPAPLRAATLRPFTSRVSTNWIVDIPDAGFESYWAARPAKLRNTIARRTRSHPVHISIHRCFEPSAWTDYENVYRASWKPTEGSPAFLRALAEQEGSAGTLRLGIAHDAEGRAVASQFWLVENGIATIHKLAHREDARAGSPGSLLSHAMFHAAIEDDRVHRIDFGLGDEPYKADWMDMPRPIYRIDAYRPTSLRGMAGIGREVASRLARRRAVD
ncbi:GNAT family N-acetyltransferase [Sphingomonas sp. PR090111-T3T-6A]|uniref:GNAT family N-acetyltransferase n=1 Tax=Sphingomonas sp. PR090111-T3T-6A TaxID=685778 RepID=UPI0003815111|nr:GNAT family N-acetyltransferase [Sphingomonas sp. PR090111-T3T-6A]